MWDPNSCTQPSASVSSEYSAFQNKLPSIPFSSRMPNLSNKMLWKLNKRITANSQIDAENVIFMTCYEKVKNLSFFVH
jgi:hypothetical protein